MEGNKEGERTSERLEYYTRGRLRVVENLLRTSERLEYYTRGRLRVVENL